MAHQEFARFWWIPAATNRNDLTRAILEGVAFGYRDCTEALQSTGARFEQRWAIGEGSASDYWPNSSRLFCFNHWHGHRAASSVLH